MKLHVLLRTCDKSSIESNRIVDKKECVEVCLKSLVYSMNRAELLIGNNLTDLVIFDDNSSDETIKILQSYDAVSYRWMISGHDLTPKQKSRNTVKMMYDYIKKLPKEDLVYVVEDDYLHDLDSITLMLQAWIHFHNQFNLINIGIFPQDFRELYFDPKNKHNETYDKPCSIFPGPDRYWRTTWFTQESFMVQVSLIHKYWDTFLQLQDIGYVDGLWEGNTISKVWQRPDVMMLMPLDTLALHLGKIEDISNYYENKWEDMYDEWKYK